MIDTEELRLRFREVYDADVEININEEEGTFEFRISCPPERSKQVEDFCYEFLERIRSKIELVKVEIKRETKDGGI